MVHNTINHDLLSGSTSSQVHHGQRRSSSNYQSNHSRTPGGLSRGCSGPTSGPPTFLVTNCNRSSLGHRLHRNSDTSSLTRSSLNIGTCVGENNALKNRTKILAVSQKMISILKAVLKICWCSCLDSQSNTNKRASIHWIEYITTVIIVLSISYRWLNKKSSKISSRWSKKIISTIWWSLWRY